MRAEQQTDERLPPPACGAGHGCTALQAGGRPTRNGPAWARRAWIGATQSKVTPPEIA